MYGSETWAVTGMDMNWYKAQYYLAVPAFKRRTQTGTSEYEGTVETRGRFDVIQKSKCQKDNFAPV